MTGFERGNLDENWGTKTFFRRSSTCRTLLESFQLADRDKKIEKINAEYRWIGRAIGVLIEATEEKKQVLGCKLKRLDG